ncbi:unnamed protein product [Caenorhabditis bovis]|uniref:Uncharacterized protein n=1 Tax=Caenorhabditis bovis TaxID=2654633 RepID=A0A8S1ET10_9PELO|nr:unnamed protein product [Caenorhabditis bovis]
MEDALPQSPSKTSPFLSLFRRKKKVNGTKSSDNLKLTPQLQDKKKEKDFKAFGKENKNLVTSNTMPADMDGGNKKKKSAKKSKDLGKSISMDVLLEDEAAVLVEALEAIGDEKPIVARSIPKHARIVKKEDNSMKNCLFEKEVYDGMLSDSLRVCEMLQSHLDDCIVSVRAKSPDATLSYSLDGRDSGRGASSPSSTMSSTASPNTRTRVFRETHM